MADYISVTQLNRMAKQVLAQCEPLNALVVCGELSGFKRHTASGHCYFTLKDEKAAVRCVMYKDKARLLGFAPQDGMLVLAYGYASLYERDGSFQFYIEFMRPFGAGAAQMAFDALKNKLQQEGLLDPARKKPLPSVPRCIGVVTSRSGAALQDVCNVISRRWPFVKLLLAPVNVQGMEAESSISQAIHVLDADPRPDLILVTRGGGSREDLWVFNSERIARAAAACRKPVVSAVGHEIDVTILDHVADLRAPTPSAAAELCVPDKQQWIQELAVLQQNFKNSIQERCQIWYTIMLAAKDMLRQNDPRLRLEQDIRQLSAMTRAVQQAAAQRYRGGEQQLKNAAALAASLSPYNVLARGYAMITDAEGRTCPVEALQIGQSVTLHGSGGWADCIVQETGGNHTGEDHP